MFIYFSFNNDVLLRCVIWLSTLLSLSEIIILVKGIFVCSELNRTFLLTPDQQYKRLPDGVIFDDSTPNIPQGVATNFRPDPSLLHYTSAEIRTISSYSMNY